MIMCELCSGEFEQIATLEVSRVAWAVQRTDPFGALHIVVEDTNVENENIQYCMARPEANEWDLHVAWLMLGLNEDERISALAMANNLWGCDPIPYDHPVTRATPAHLTRF